MGLFDWFAPAFTGVTGWRQQTSHPLPQRYTHSTDDTRDFQQPTPRYDPTPYQTYWVGNQLPGKFINVVNPHEQWIAVRDKRQLYTNSPYAAQRSAGSFNRNLSQQTSADILATWRGVWASLAGTGGGGGQ